MSTTHKKLTLLDQWRFVQRVVSDDRLSRCAVACAFHLVDYYNHRLGRAWPSYDTLANLSGCHRRTVIEAVKRLVTFGYIEVDKGSGRRSNYYRPNFSLIRKNTDGPEPGDGEAIAPVAGTTPQRDAEVNFSAPNTSYVPVAPSEGDIEVSPRSAGSSAPRAPSPSRGAPGFDDFWQAYPKKEGHKPALAAYGAALRKDGVTPELLATKATQYAEAKQAVDPQYIKMAKNWLADECWLEDPQPPKRSKKSKRKRETMKRAGDL